MKPCPAGEGCVVPDLSEQQPCATCDFFKEVRERRLQEARARVESVKENAA